MPPSDTQTFLRELDKKLWTATDRLRFNLDAVVYKHAVHGLIFLKYVSDSFAERQKDIEEMIRDPDSDLHLRPADYGTFTKYNEAIAAELEERDYYIEKNVFWVPALARWKTLQDSAKLPAGTEINMEKGFSPPLNKNHTQLQIDQANLAGFIDLIATIPFQHADLHAKDILGNAPKASPSNSSSATRGDLCAFAVEKSSSSIAICGVDFDFGKEPADTFTRDQHPDLRADFVMANPTAHAPASQLENRKTLNSSILCV